MTVLKGVSLMKRAGLTGAIALAACVSAGCQPSDPYARYDLEDARDIVAASMDSIGGLDAWREVDYVDCNAVVRVYDEKGQPYVNRQRQRIDIDEAEISATATTPRGRWSATIDADGEGDVSGAVDPGRWRLIRPALATLAHRVRGPLNLLRGDERADGADTMTVGGYEVVRVGVSGDSSNAVAYYFDVHNGTLRFVTSGADGPGREGTVTLYTWGILENGMAFPRSITVVKIGQNVLIGPETLIEADFADIEIHRRRFAFPALAG